MQNEARFEFVLIEGGENAPSAGGAPDRSSGLEETNRLLQKILEAQGFRRAGGDGAQQATKPVSADDLATLPTETAKTPSHVTPSIATESRPVAVPPSSRVTLPEPAKPPVAPDRPQTPQPTLPNVSTPASTEVSPPTPTSQERPDATPPSPATTTPRPVEPPSPATTTSARATDAASLEDMSRQLRDETKAMGDKLADELFGERRRRRDAERGIIQAERAPLPKASDTPTPTLSGRDTPKAVDTDLEEMSRQLREETQAMGDKLADELFNKGRRRRESSIAPKSNELSTPPPPLLPPAPPVPPPAFTIPESVPAIGGLAVGSTAAATIAGVGAGAIAIAGIAKANYEIVQGMDTLAKALAPKLVNYSPQVAAAQAAAELREVMRAFSTSDRLGESVGRLVEANSVIKDSMAQLRDVISGPIMADVASMKEGLAGILSVAGNFAEKNQAVYDALYNVATRYLPGPQQIIGDLAKLGEIVKALTGYESKTGSFDQIFMDNGMITPPGWSNTPETDISTSFADPGVELP